MVCSITECRITIQHLLHVRHWGTSHICFVYLICNVATVKQVVELHAVVVRQVQSNLTSKYSGVLCCRQNRDSVAKLPSSRCYVTCVAMT